MGLALHRELQGRSVAVDREDVAYWRPHPSSFFSVRSCYTWWRRHIPPNMFTAGKAREIWRSKIPLKVKFFLWLMYQRKLLTKAYRAKWAPNEDATCQICGGGLETTDHLMLECPVAIQIWSRLTGATDFVANLSSMEELWTGGRRLCSRRDKSAKAKVSQTLIPAVTWAIWLSRNLFLFRGTPVNVENIWASVVNFITFWGTSCAGAKRVHFIRDRLSVEE
ncbi:hypothetical protein QJS04_geneDACA008656 [Acorus gramineus]|uniref:Reverse transcriptase zinc-binding domain-containing protein n=1 Tax=Acorus gramineus TaxID=55184 RepID=A0AAV9AJX9_ACOGR|nr:hypothetical protein QJS04_geneDACA008656 [Acorus gramineus]